MEDREIVSLFWERKESAIRQSKTKYDAYLMKIAGNILSNTRDSEEVVNDAYLAAWDSIPPQKPENLRTYLSKITRRIAIDRYRAENREKRKSSRYALSLDELSQCLPDNSTPEDAVDEKLLAASICRFLAAEGQESRDLFIGRYFYLDSLRDAAQYCGMSESKAKMLLYRTRLKLKQYLEEEGYTL